MLARAWPGRCAFAAALRVCVRRPAIPAAATAAIATIQTTGLNFFEADNFDTTVLLG